MKERREGMLAVVPVTVGRTATRAISRQHHCALAWATGVR